MRLDKIEAAAALHVVALESTTAMFESWCPYIESSIDGVKGQAGMVHKLPDEIKADVIVQRPLDLDTAAVLAQL
ncbi:hypothetical protein PR202_gb16242 [Eleusine coracana subsp. coracana]|uniref:Uncharacterized protein n=1 Tax=Eleusine coracana subsp. coracana TaxID=191504 RepID=A0AAV5F004_ELECO|nr:hypothetical protein PR202_gb16242 [Eleusine coracana subsp. coracana]